MFAVLGEAGEKRKDEMRMGEKGGGDFGIYFIVKNANIFVM